MAGYAFARIEFPFKNFIFVLLLSVLMVPGQIFLLPQYQLIQKMGLLNTIPALFLPNLFSAFGTFLLRQFFMSMPQELEDAAIVDGCNRFQIFGRIMVPLIQPGIAALTIFTFKFAWNDFMWPLIVNNSMDKLILGPALSTLQGQYTTQYPMQMAGAVLAVIPLVVIFFIFQKQFIESVARMAPKRVVYVSCNPVTLARDLELLTRKGYKVESSTPVDMFPHSEHIEVVCSMVRVKKH